MRSQAFKPPKRKRRPTAGPAMPRNRSRKQTERALEAQLEREANAERRRNQNVSKKQMAVTGMPVMTVWTPSASIPTALS